MLLRQAPLTARIRDRLKSCTLFCHPEATNKGRREDLPKRKKRLGGMYTPNFFNATLRAKRFLCKHIMPEILLGCASHCFAVRLRYAPLRMTRAGRHGLCEQSTSRTMYAISPFVGEAFRLPHPRYTQNPRAVYAPLFCHPERANKGEPKDLPKRKQRFGRYVYAKPF